MAAKKKKRMSPAEQHARFLKAAVEVQVDPAAFDRAFKKVDLRKKPPKPQ
jgi:hypothetical protein